VREIIRVKSVSSRMLKGNVAYVRIKQFQDRTHDELLAALARLRTESHGRITGVLLDLRSNPGGLVDSSTSVADEFLEGGTIFSARHRGQIVDDVKAHSGGALVGVPTVVLVNAYTASAAELLTGALQDARRARVVGVQTFGKGSVQTIFELPGGAGMRLTTERYYTPSGHAIQADGIHPDVLVNASDAAGVPVVRERDLEGHLDAEERGGGSRAAVVVDAGVQPEPNDTQAEAADGSVAKSIPFDPEAGRDVMLKVGYATLTHG
jgi:carboxyl-terminal processing protease